MFKNKALHAAAVAMAMLIGQVHAADTKSVNVPAGDLTAALETLARQSGVELVYRPEQLKGLRTKGVQGTLSSQEAVKKLIEGTALEVSADPSGVLLISAANAPVKTSATAAGRAGPFVRLAQSGSESAAIQKAEDTETQDSKGIPEILVKGSKILNMDVRRSRDDPQPWVVFDRQQIQNAGAANLEDFFRRRLTMNTQQGMNSQQVQNNDGNRSQVNLRGLGQLQTLILIDGRRSAITAGIGAGLRQYDVNGIPLAAIERIEVLPTTASGIYGGNATGGVVNIIMRRDYRGIEGALTYDNTFDTDSAKRRAELSGGFELEEGRTNVSFSGSWSDSNVLSRADRGFLRAYRDRSFANNPALNLSAFQGSTPNIRSAQSSGGVLQNLVLKPAFGGTNLGSTFTYIPSGYAGVAGSGVAGLVNNAGKFNLDEPASPEALVNNPTVASMQATISREFSSKVRVFLDGSAATNTGHGLRSFGDFYVGLAADAPNNPFQQAIGVVGHSAGAESEQVTRGTDRHLTGGVMVKLPLAWQAQADYAWSRQSNSLRFDPPLIADAAIAMSEGTLDVMRDTSAYPLDLSPYMQTITSLSITPSRTTTGNATMMLSGPVGSLPGGRPVLSVKLEHRKESIAESALTAFDFDGGVEYYPSRSQSVSSAYTEIRVPLFSASNGLPFVRELQVQLSGRVDDYTVNGVTGTITAAQIAAGGVVARFTNKERSANPTLGLSWKPVEDVMVRASYGTGFLPPNVNQLVPSAASTVVTNNTTIRDPLRGGSLLGVHSRRGGGNPDLQPEDSRSWSAGAVLTPRFAPQLRLSLDFTRIEKQGNIGSHPQGVQGLVDDEALFPGRITRGANLPGDPVGWAGPITFINTSLLNIALADVEAYDLQLDYSLESARLGTFDIFAMATWQTHYQTQTKQGQPVLENSGFNQGVLRFKANGGVAWNGRDWRVGWNFNYLDSYCLAVASVTAACASAAQILEQGSPRVKNQVYHDVFGSYRFADAGSGSGLGMLGARMLAGMEVTVGVRNILNTAPARQLTSYSFYGDARLASYYVSLKRSFD